MTFASVDDSTHNAADSLTKQIKHEFLGLSDDGKVFWQIPA